MTKPKQAQPSPTAIQPAPLLSVAHQIADRGVYGLAWLDADLIVTARFGPITEAIEIGAPIADSLPMLMGYEPEIKQLSEVQTGVFNLPGVKRISAEREEPQLNLTIFPDKDSTGFILLIGQVLAATDSELELTKQMRARLIAEEEVARKSNELAEANAELELANRDLEDYAAVISHDLKSPLRAIRYMADDAEKAVAAGSTTAASTALQTLKTQSLRMSSMLGALLDYASVGRKSDVAEVIDTDALVRSIIKAMPRPAGFTIAIDGTWPTLTTALAPLDVVIRNLVDNAIKHHDLADGTVTLTGQPVSDTAGAFVFTIHDDGPGISPKNQNAIFLPFRTLSRSADVAAGSGMGLAFVQRTLTTIGGSISVTSDPAIKRGTTFVVTWPSDLSRPE
ncbi:MAG: HAMP domain-containing sensor histidine kinase [Pseudomonadota bacterium]